MTESRWSRILFGNRYFYPRTGVLLLLLVSALHYSGRTGEFINPAFWRCQADPAAYHGQDVWVPYATVERVEATGFWIATPPYRIFVLGETAGLAASDQVTLRGIFKNSPERGVIQVTGIRKMIGTHWKGNTILGVSVAVFLFVLWRCRRIFMLNPDAICFKER